MKPEEQIRPNYYKTKVWVTLDCGDRVTAELECFDLWDALPNLGVYSKTALKHLFRLGNKPGDPRKDFLKAATYCQHAAQREFVETPAEPITEETICSGCHRPQSEHFGKGQRCLCAAIGGTCPAPVLPGKE